MRGKVVKKLRAIAARIASEENLPIATYEVKNKQTKYYPITQDKVAEYETATIYLGESQRKIYRKLKKNRKLK